MRAREAGGVHALGQAQAHQQHLPGALGGGHRLLGAAVALALHQGGPGLRRAVAAGGEQRAVHRDAAVRAGADAGVVAVAPVGQVVAALRTRAGVVGDLVGVQAVGGGLLGGGLVEGGGVLALGQHQGALAVQRLEGGAGLHGELVERQVVGGERQRLAQLRAPGGQRLLRAGVDQVEGQAGEGRARELQRGARLGGVVLPAEHAQGVGVERLHAEREAVHPGLPEGGEPPRLHAGRVGLQRHLEVRQRREQPGRVLQQGGHGGGVHQARRAAAEEHRAERARPQPCRLPRELAPERGGEALLGDHVAHVAVEVAVRALVQAEGPVDVEREGFHRRGCGGWQGRKEASSFSEEKEAKRLRSVWHRTLGAFRAKGAKVFCFFFSKRKRFLTSSPAHRAPPRRPPTR